MAEHRSPRITAPNVTSEEGNGLIVCQGEQAARLGYTGRGGLRIFDRIGRMRYHIGTMMIAPTLSHYLLRHLVDHPAQKDLVLMMSDLATIGKIISSKTNRAGLAGILGAEGRENVQGEQVQKLDHFANELCKNILGQTGHFAALASEEEDGTVVLNEGADYVISFDPLDGSSNIDVNVSIGTIFSVHRRLPDLQADDPRHFLQKGREQVLAGYILYGASTVIVFSLGDGVHEFTLDQGIGDFLLTNERLILPEQVTYYSVNEINLPLCDERDRHYVDWVKKEFAPRGRYIGSLVADIHRNLLKGGIFLYPVVENQAKLRLNFEAKPMAFLMEQAGGAATNGFTPILELVPDDLHQRVPLLIGNRSAVEPYPTIE